MLNDRFVYEVSARKKLRIVRYKATERRLDPLPLYAWVKVLRPFMFNVVLVDKQGSKDDNELQ